MKFGWTSKVDMRTGAQLEIRHMVLLVMDAKSRGKNMSLEEEGTRLEESSAGRGVDIILS